MFVCLLVCCFLRKSKPLQKPSEEESPILKGWNESTGKQALLEVGLEAPEPLRWYLEKVEEQSCWLPAVLAPEQLQRQP